MSAFVQRFGTSSARNAILLGLLDFRAQLKRIGIIDGFQWLDGSFVENKEAQGLGPPNDVDVITFSRLPVSASDPSKKNAFLMANLNVFDSDRSKATFKCDAYFVDLDIPPLVVVDRTRYWFGLFSHKRVSALWKGMVQVDLNSDDTLAKTLI